MLDPNDFVITRKRKKYKFALFANSPLCFEADEWTKRPIDVVELGAGTGSFVVELAARYPQKTFMAVDVKADRLQYGAKQAEQQHFTNVFFVRARADQLHELFAPHSLETIWLTFSDPFPKKRSAGRRMTHGTYLDIYQKLLQSQGTLNIKHDSRDFFCWSLEQLVAKQWRLAELSFDLHDTEIADDYTIKTVYELRWLKEGSLINFTRALPPEAK